MGELTEQHGDQLGPAVKAFGAAFRIVCFDQRGELGPGKMLKQLIEQTRDLYDGFAFLVGGVWRSSDPGTIRQRPNYRRAFLLLRRESNLFWTRVINGKAVTRRDAEWRDVGERHTNKRQQLSDRRCR
mgnify:CR=1 FL=1